MSVGFCRHLVGKTLRNKYVTVIVLKYALLVSHINIFLNWLIHFYLNNTINLRHLTQRIISCYTHKMAIVS